MRNVLIFMLIPFLSLGQDFNVFTKVKEDVTYITWVNKSASEWRIANRQGYTVTITDQDKKVIYNEIIINQLYKYKDLPESDDRRLLYELVYNPDAAQKLYGSKIYTEADADEIEDQLFENYYFTSCQNYSLLEASGLAIQVPLLMNNTYIIEVKPNGIEDKRRSAISSFRPADYQDPKVQEMTSKWKSKRVDLSWTHKNHTETFNYYNTYYSEDGQNWTQSDSALVNFYPASSHEDLLRMTVRKDLLENEKPYWFKLHGVDFFGEESADFTLVKGSASKGIQVSPYWKSMKQLRTNQAHMKWDIPDETKTEVEEFRIYVAENYDGPYLPDTVGLSPSTFEIMREIPFRSAYFRIIAVDRNQEEFSSFPQLIVGVDTLAPEIPANLSYTIDTTGQVHIKWDSNDEEDFIGYKLFYSYDTSVDMTLAHNSYLITPEFMDTLELRTTTRDVYYKAISVDKRNNRSDFSKLLIVKKPDILPPIEPVFISADGGPGSCKITWYSSISNDVKEQRLFRRKLGDEESWSLVELWDSNKLDTTYLDSGLIAFEKYAYTLTVIDSAGNESDASRPVIVMPVPDYREFDASNWQAKLIKGNVQITHEFDPTVVEKFFIYRKIDDGNLYSIAELAAKQSIFIDEKISKDKVYSYAIKVMFKEGIETPLSAFKEIKI